MNDIMEKLIQSLQLLANDYEVQARSLPEFVHVPDEVALVFDDIYIFINDHLSKGLVTVEQKSKEPPVKTGGILEFKQSLPAVFFALHFDIFPYSRLTYANR